MFLRIQLNVNMLYQEFISDSRTTATLYERSADMPDHSSKNAHSIRVLQYYYQILK